MAPDFMISAEKGNTLPTSISLERIERASFPAPQLGLAIIFGLPLVALAIALGVASLLGMSSTEYGLAFAEYAKTMM